jgi:hypothetical protein
MEFYSAVIKKIDSSGNLIWSKTYDNPTESDGYPGDDVIKSVRQTSDGGYIATGYFENENSWSLVSWVIKTDELGDIVWSKTYKKNNSTDTWAEDVIETDDGGFILTGNQKNDGNKAHAMLRKYNADGEVVWHKTYTRVLFLLVFLEPRTGTTSILLLRLMVREIVYSKKDLGPTHSSHLILW